MHKQQFKNFIIENHTLVWGNDLYHFNFKINQSNNVF